MAKIAGEVTLKRTFNRLSARAKGSAAVIGDKELLAVLDGLSKQSVVNRMLRPGVAEAGRAVRDKAKELAPRETGLLRDSIASKTITLGGKVVVAIVGPRRDRGAVVFRTRPDGSQQVVESDPARYAHLVELGTARVAPQPFLRPAWDLTNAMKIIRRRTTSEVRKAAQGRAKNFKRADRILVSALRKAEKQ